jgi:hypothetical protein
METEINTLYIRAENCSETKNYEFIEEVIFSLFPEKDYSFIIDHHYLSWLSRKQAQKLAEEIKVEFLLYRKPFFRNSGTPINSFSMEIKSANDLNRFFQYFGRDTDDFYLRIIKKTSKISSYLDKSLIEGEKKYEELLTRDDEYHAVAFISCRPLDIIIHSCQRGFENGVGAVQKIAEQAGIKLDENKVLFN